MNISPGEPRMSPTAFVAKWLGSNFGEKQASQEMFLDICGILGHPTPGDYGDKDVFTFEKPVPGGVPDAYLEGRFGWEFKGGDADLDGAMNQLLRYQVHLKTPPLLIVSSFNTIRIRTNFPGMETVLYEVPVAELARQANLAKLRNAFYDPDQLRPGRTVDQVTRETADLFQAIVEDMEQRTGDSENLARYLNQIVFCLYAEDAGLLPGNPFSEIVRGHNHNPELFDEAIRNLFGQMATGGLFGAVKIARFNGDLFSNTDTVELSGTALLRLEEATRKNWRNIEPSIFGTLFERALDASKRAHLGAHYTSADDIMLVVEPVVMAPLRREWESVQQEVGNLLSDGHDDAARVRLGGFQQRLFEVEVLDPACGSGNFLYLALRSLLDLEREVIDFAAMNGWTGLTPTVKPDQMRGLEVNPYATELARTALWIGYIQWHQNNGFPYDHSPIYPPLCPSKGPTPFLPATARGIHRNRSGRRLSSSSATRPSWAGNSFAPTWAMSTLMRCSVCTTGGCQPRPTWSATGSRRPGICWTGNARSGANRNVLRRIKESGDIFLAWSDQPWVLEGAAVHTSIVGFDDGSETVRELDGETVGSINANLTEGPDITEARRLKENLGIGFMGDTKGGPFDISESVALSMLEHPNPDGRDNRDVVRPRVNGKDITSRPSGTWIIDFGVDLPLSEAALYEAPFEYVNEHVRPVRVTNKRKVYAENWWLHMEPRPGMRQALDGLSRYLVTPTTAKHRLFTWLSADVLPDHALIAVARDDDYTFGVLHSRFHEVWALAMGTQLREVESGFRYTPTTCFETFPFPEPTDAQREAIAEAARKLDELRQGWLNPTGVTAADLKKRTLTNLYNAYPTWLQNLHEQLDHAIAPAYGWPHDLSGPEMLEQLLMLNRQRAP